MMRDAATIGPATIALIEAIMSTKPHPEQGFRACLGILRLAQKLRLGTRGSSLPAWQRDRRHHLWLDRLDPEERPRPEPTHREPTPEAPPIRHGNIRGTGYYH